MRSIFLPSNASKARMRDAEQARRNRAEIVRELSWGRVSRRDLLKWGLFTSAGHAGADRRPQPVRRERRRPAARPACRASPLFGAKPFTQPMPRFDVLPRESGRCLTPALPGGSEPDADRRCDPLLGGGYRPVRGTSAGLGVGASAVQRVPAGRLRRSATQAPATTNYSYDPQVPSSLNSGIDPSHGHAAAVPPEPADPEPELGVDVQRHDSAEAGAGPLRRADPVPPPQRAARRRHAERRLRAPHDLDPRAQRPPRGGERRLHRRVLLPGPVLRLPLADRPRRALQHEHAARPIRWPARPTTAAASPRSRATGTRR